MRDIFDRLRRSRAVRWSGNFVAAVLLVTGLIGLPSVPEDLSRWGPVIQGVGAVLERLREIASPIATDAGRWIAVVLAAILFFLLNSRAGSAQADRYPVSMEEESARRAARDRAGAAIERRWNPEEVREHPVSLQTAPGAASGEPSEEGTSEGWRNPASNEKTVVWCERHRPRALTGLHATSKADHVEICAKVIPPLAVTRQRSLLDAVRESNIETFGWPIGVVIESRDESRPRPVADGVVVDFAWAERGTYDYWAMSVRGEFFSLTNLSEDVLGRPDALLFNTRIVRVAETVMFLASVYRALGSTDDARVSVSIRHVGLDHRVLSAAGNRKFTLTHERTAAEAEAVTTATFTLREADQFLVEIVKALLAPVFHLYEFGEFADEVYEDLVSNFREGRVT